MESVIQGRRDGFVLSLSMVLTFSCLFCANVDPVLLGPEGAPRRGLGEPESADAQGIQGSVMAPLNLSKSNLTVISKRTENFDQTLNLGHDSPSQQQHEDKKLVKVGGTKTLQEALLLSTLMKRNGDNTAQDVSVEP